MLVHTIFIYPVLRDSVVEFNLCSCKYERFREYKLRNVFFKGTNPKTECPPNPSKFIATNTIKMMNL